jgi:hypothetical protein
MSDRVPGLVMLVFILAGTVASIIYGDNMGATISREFGRAAFVAFKGLVGAMSGLGLFFFFISGWVRHRAPRE